jgi:dolichol-phosphate mannosyltransferase
LSNNKIVVIGASGFVGAGIFERLFQENYDVYGIGTKLNPWRIQPPLSERYFSTKNSDLNEILNKLQPDVIINFAAHGAYSFQNSFETMVSSNLTLLEKLALWAKSRDALLIHAGSSSEYGTQSAGPLEDALVKPNSLYAITKLAGTQLLEFYSTLGLRSTVLRLYSVYGPKEDSSRLIPAVMRGIVKREWPNFTDPKISRDFIYLDDIAELVTKIINAPAIKKDNFFEIYNVASGKITTINDLKNLLMSDFQMPNQQNDSYPKRGWDVENWYGNISKIQRDFNWTPKTELKSGLLKLKNWYLDSDNVKYLGKEFTEK